MFDQRDILGYDEETIIRHFLHKVLISENVVKYKFNEHYDPKTKRYKENIVGFNKTIVKYQLIYFRKDSYTKNMTEVTSAKNSDGLSGLDKMEMNLSKLDEGLIILSDIGVKSEIDAIMRDNDFGITDDEIDYYIKNHHPSDLQIKFVKAYYGKYFGSGRNTNLIGRRDYIKLLLILKKKLLLQAGYEAEDGFAESTIFPYLLTGNVQDKVNTRLIRNTKYLSKVEASDAYQNLIRNKYSKLNKIRKEYFLSLLSQINNTMFTYVVYEEPELLGREIEYSEDKISDELLFFLSTL